MCDCAAAVIPLPLSVVESNLWDVTAWSTFLTGVQSIRLSAHERYLLEVREGHRLVDVFVAMRWHPRERYFSWEELQGPPWRGELRLKALNGRRTKVTLSLETEPRTLRGRLAQVIAGHGGGVEEDIARLQERFSGIPQPFNPARLVPAGQTSDELAGRGVDHAIQLPVDPRVHADTTT
jgi:hypothetical protein